MTLPTQIVSPAEIKFKILEFEAAISNGKTELLTLKVSGLGIVLLKDIIKANSINFCIAAWNNEINKLKTRLYALEPHPLSPSFNSDDDAISSPLLKEEAKSHKKTTSEQVKTATGQRFMRRATPLSRNPNAVADRV
jgi:hypothetical protein